MAEDQDRSREDLTEEASPHRVEEYRNKGMVAQSREVTGLAVLLATGVSIYAYGPRMGSDLLGYMREVFQVDLSARVDLGSKDVIQATIIHALKTLAFVGLPICLEGFIAGIVSCYAQVGSIFSTDPLTPDLTKVNPLEGIKRFFSSKQILEGLKLVLKMTIIVAVAYGAIKTEILKSALYLGTESEGVLKGYGSVGWKIFYSLGLVMAVFAGIDFWFQRWEFGKNLKMTKQEAKQEHKEREGDPQIKARIRAVQREIARRRMMAAVRKADVVITNPTHFAVAIVYDKQTMAAPKVVAKGADYIAQKIKKIAAEAGVPMVENVPLARTLYKTVKVNHPIPRALYQAVAEVLAYIYKLKGGK